MFQHFSFVLSFVMYKFPETLPSFADTILLSMWGEKVIAETEFVKQTLKNIQSLCYKNCRMVIQAVLSRNNMSEESDLDLYHHKLLHLLKTIA